MRVTRTASELPACRGRTYLARLGGLFDQLPFRVALIVAPPGYNDDLAADAVLVQHCDSSMWLDMADLGADGIIPALGRLLGMNDADASLDRTRDRLQAATTLLVVANVPRVLGHDQHDALQALLPRSADRWSALLTSSVHPGLDLTAYHADGEALVVSSNDLRYRVEEIAELLASIGATAVDPASLHDLTFGWPVAVETTASLLRMGWSEDDALVQLEVEVAAHLDATVWPALNDGERRAVELLAVLGEIDAEIQSIVGCDVDGPAVE